MASSRPEASERGDPDERDWLLAAADRRAEDAEVGERLEVERAAGTWVARLTACCGQVVSLRTVDGTSHTGALVDTAESWAVVEAAGRARLVMLTEVVWVVAPRTGSATSTPRVRRGTGSVFRRWGRLRSPVAVVLRDGTSVHGQVMEVLHDAVTLRPEAAPDQEVTVPFSAVAWAMGEPLPVE